MRILATKLVNFNQKSNNKNSQMHFGSTMYNGKFLNAIDEKKLLDGLLDQTDSFRFLIHNPKWNIKSEFQIAGKATVIDLGRSTIVDNKLVIRRPKEDDFIIIEEGMSRETFEIFTKIQEKLSSIMSDKMD